MLRNGNRWLRKFSSSAHKSQLESSVVESLRNIRPEFFRRRDLISLGCVRNIKIDEESGRVHIGLHLGISNFPDFSQLISACTKELEKMPWVKQVVVDKLVPQSRHLSLKQKAEELAVANIRNIVAVSSCKGGVGKSTIAVNLAVSLLKQGCRVGLLDADVYGPSLPYLIQPADVIVQRSTNNPKFILPLDYHVSGCVDNALKVLSFGFVNPKAGVAGAGGKGAAILRGPMVSKVVTQMIAATEWGDLDVLVVDFPPGTGDIQITLCQSLSLSGAIIVTTPQRLSRVDVVKGIEMFQELRVPILGIVENMAYFECNNGGSRHLHYPFGKTSSVDIAQMNNIPLDRVYQLPLTEQITDCNEEMTPVTDKYPESQSSLIFSSVADNLVRDLVNNKFASDIAPSISWSPDRLCLDGTKGGFLVRYFSQSNAEEHMIPTNRLRNVVAKGPAPTGKQFNAVPVKVHIKGNYGVQIVWSDGNYEEIIDFDRIREIVNEISK